jgi:hypothetical protein
MKRTIATVIGAFALGWCLLGIAGAILGEMAPPTAPAPPAAVSDAAAGKPLDAVAVHEYLEYSKAMRRPGQVLVWGVLPAIAAALGFTTAMADRRFGLYAAPVSFFLVWRTVFWGERWDRDDWRDTLAYMGVAAVSAFMVVWIRRSRERQLAR